MTPEAGSARDTIVVDLDGTLSDCSARRYLVEGKRRDYEAFHARLGEDPPNEAVATTVRAMAEARWEVHLVSARPKYTAQNTWNWLARHDLAQFVTLHLLRDDDDSTPDQELKRRWLHEFGKERILFVIDDRSKVVDMWREEGLTCFHCAPWVPYHKAKAAEIRGSR